jgi:hypothetical protein
MSGSPTAYQVTDIRQSRKSRTNRKDRDQGFEPRLADYTRRAESKRADNTSSEVRVTRTVALSHQQRCLSIDTQGCRKLFHTFRDNFGQLHHLLSELGVSGNIALNAIAVGV